MAKHNPSLFGFWDVNTKQPNGLLLKLAMVLFVFLPCFVEVPLGLAGEAQGKSDIGGLMVGKSAAQGGRNAIGFINVTQISQDVVESRLETEARGVPKGGASALPISGSRQQLIDKDLKEHEQEPRRKDGDRKSTQFDWHAFLLVFGLVVFGGLVSICTQWIMYLLSKRDLT